MEYLGTAILAFAIVGSGIMATNLTSDSALRLLINAISTAIGLAVVIRVGMKVSPSGHSLSMGALVNAFKLK